MKARELGRRSVVVGDRVAIVGDVAGGADTLARIVRVEPRTSMLRRTADDTDPVERVIVANADQLVDRDGARRPAARPRLIDRCLVAAFDAGRRRCSASPSPTSRRPTSCSRPTGPSTSPHVVIRRGESWTRCASS